MADIHAKHGVERVLKLLEQVAFQLHLGMTMDPETQIAASPLMRQPYTRIFGWILYEHAVSPACVIGRQRSSCFSIIILDLPLETCLHCRSQRD